MLTTRDLAEIIGSQMTEMQINPTSLSLVFGCAGHGRGWLLIQCDFSLLDANGEVSGSADFPQSGACLKRCLKQILVDASFDDHKVLILRFEDGLVVRITPKLDGLESYVLHTSQGIVPIIAI